MEYNSHFLILSSVRRKTSPVQENHCKMLCFKGANFGWTSEVSRVLERPLFSEGKREASLHPTEAVASRAHFVMLSQMSHSCNGFYRGEQVLFGDTQEVSGVFSVVTMMAWTLTAFIRYESGIPRDSLLTRDSHHIPHDFQTSSLTSV